MSVAEPAGNGTIRRTGRSGQVAVAAAPGRTASATSASSVDTTRVMMSTPGRAR